MQDPNPQNPNQFPQQNPNYPPNYQQPYPGQPPYQQQQPPKKKLGIFKIGCISLIAIVVLAVIIGVASGGGKNNSTTNPSTSPKQQPQVPNKPQNWTTTHTYNGSGAKKTETITVPSDWKIQWTCTPSSFMGNSYNVIIGVYNTDGTPADLAAVNTMCKDGNTSGETEERTSGNIYLDVNSEGDWNITIQELK